MSKLSNVLMVYAIGLVLVASCAKPHVDSNLPSAAPMPSASGKRHPVLTDEASCHEDEGLKCAHKNEVPLGISEIRTKMLCCSQYVDE